ncbi:MAG: signal peptide peptidase SppA [Clostridia bacterium]|nr:signal peptide peptidase SppA [Deltaproteobacteria bacterium]
MSWILYVLAGIGSLIVAALLGGAVFWVLRRLRRHTLPHEILLELELHGPIVERAPEASFAKLLGTDPTTIGNLTRALDRAKDDPRVKGIIVNFGSPVIALGHAQELRDAFVRFRGSKKLLVATTDTFGEGGPGNLLYFLASACSAIYVQSSGDVGLMGLRLEQPFIKRALDTLGVQARIGQRESYKNAPNMFLETGLTEAHKTSLSGLANSIMSELTQGIAAGRNRPVPEVERWFNDGPFTATEALAKGIIDGVRYRDEVYDDVRKQAGEKAHLIYLDRYRAKLRPLKPTKNAPVVAVVRGSGAVQRHAASESIPGRANEAFDASSVTAALRAARRDEDVKAVLFRIDSPGGSYVAADSVWREVEATRLAGKPVIVSMVNAAASGGYFAAAPATKVVAQPLTLTGSIGVFGGKVVFRDLATKLGVDFDGIQTHANADMTSPTRDYTPGQRAELETQLDRIYDDFLGKVATGRKLTLEETRAVAQGRVWTGREALANKLVDALGGFEKAIELVKVELKVTPETRLALQDFPSAKSLWERVRGTPPANSEKLGVSAYVALGLVEVIEDAQRRSIAKLAQRLLAAVGIECSGVLPTRLS